MHMSKIYQELKTFSVVTKIGNEIYAHNEQLQCKHTLLNLDIQVNMVSTSDLIFTVWTFVPLTLNYPSEYAIPVTMVVFLSMGIVGLPYVLNCCPDTTAEMCLIWGVIPPFTVTGIERHWKIILNTCWILFKYWFCWNHSFYNYCGLTLWQK